MQAMNRTYFRMVSALAAFLFAACSQDELGQQGTSLPEGIYPLEIASATLRAEVSTQPWAADAPQTRVSENNPDRNSSKWDGGDIFYAKPNGASEAGKFQIQESGIAVLTPTYWTQTTDGVTAWHALPETESGTIDLSDQTEGLAYLLQAIVDKAPYDNPVSLKFSHQLSKIRVKFEGDKASDVSKVSIESYTTCVHTNGTVNRGENNDEIRMYRVDNTNIYEANVVPGREITRFKVNGGEWVALSTEVTPVKGEVHEITIDVKKASLKPVDGKFTVNDGDNVLIKDYEGTEPIVVNGTATITLDNVKLTTENTAMEINNGATVMLNVVGKDNSLASTNGSGIGAHEGSSIIIKGESINNSKLTVSSGKDRNVGIGFITNTGGGTFSYGNIEIANVTLSVEGGDSGAAIGTTGAVNTFSNQLVCGNITINNSNVTANSKNANACIGTSSWSVNQALTWNVISIMNSTITAKSEGNGYGDYAACIGMGYVGLGSVTIKKIEINNSTLNLSTDASYKVGKGTIKGGTVIITEGIYVNGNNQGSEGWNP